MINWNRRKYTPEQFAAAWKSSESIRQVALKLGLDARGEAYRVIQRGADDLGLKSDHMKPYGFNNETKRNQHTANPLRNILVKNSTYTNTASLKSRLIKNGDLIYKCKICGIDTHNGKKIVLQIDHINGDKLDHRIKNLRLICPNCHSQTKTYRGRNKGH